VLEDGYDRSTVEAGEAGEDRYNSRWDHTDIGIILLTREVHARALAVHIAVREGCRYIGDE
jgi:hypothetical protein